MTAAWKKLRFISSVRSDFHMTAGLLIAVHVFASHVLMSFSVDQTLLLRQVNLFITFRGPPFSVEMSPLWSKHMYSVLFALAWRPMPLATCSRLWSRVSAWAGEFVWSAMSSVYILSPQLSYLKIPRRIVDLELLAAMSGASCVH